MTMLRTWEKWLGGQAHILLAAALLLSLVGSLVAPQLARAAAGDNVWSADTDIQLDNGIGLRILAGSEAESLVVNALSVVINADGVTDFVIEALAPATKMTNTVSAGDT